MNCCFLCENLQLCGKKFVDFVNEVTDLNVSAYLLVLRAKAVFLHEEVKLSPFYVDLLTLLLTCNVCPPCTSPNAQCADQ